MKTRQTPLWIINLPDDWEDEEDDEGVTLFDPAGSGTLRISALERDEEVDDAFLDYMAAEHLEAGAEPEAVEYGDFDGLGLSYGDDDHYWREWYLRADSVMLYVTYHCPLVDEGREDDTVEAILETLSLA
ncbi:MAG: hypothetical protein WCY26_09560 [Thiohalobacteraceae bacterium]|nr:hypothetical protein [Gammaproteobacteria bacterium]